MIGQYLSNKNESATVAKTKIFTNSPAGYSDSPLQST